MSDLSETANEAILATALCWRADALRRVLVDRLHAILVNIVPAKCAIFPVPGPWRCDSDGNVSVIDTCSGEWRDWRNEKMFRRMPEDGIALTIGYVNFVHGACDACMIRPLEQEAVEESA